MAYLNFTDALMESKRRARLQGREVSQQEAAGISEGIGSVAADRSVQIEQLAQNKEQFDKSLAENRAQYSGTMAARTSEFEKTLAETKSQYSGTMAQREKEFAASVEQSQKQYELAVQTLTAQIAQYEASSAAQRAQFGEQMKYQIAESARKAEEYKTSLAAQQSQFNTTATNAQANYTSGYELQKAQYGSQLAAAGQPLPSIFAPSNWDAVSYLKNNPDVANDPYYGKNPLNHYYLLGKNEGRSW